MRASTLLPDRRAVDLRQFGGDGAGRRVGAAKMARHLVEPRMTTRQMGKPGSRPMPAARGAAPVPNAANHLTVAGLAQQPKQGANRWFAGSRSGIAGTPGPHIAVGLGEADEIVMNHPANGDHAVTVAAVGIELVHQISDHLRAVARLPGIADHE